MQQSQSNNYLRGQLDNKHLQLTPTRIAIPTDKVYKAPETEVTPLEVSSGVSLVSSENEEFSTAENLEVYMRCVTWSRDSHGLFDYESRYINKKNIKTLDTGKVVRIDNDVEFIPSDSLATHPLAQVSKPLLSLNRKGSRLFVSNDTVCEEANPTEHNKMFVVVRNVRANSTNTEEQSRFSGEHRMNKGDIIKMGRLKFLVRDFRSAHQAANIDSTEVNNSPVKKTFRATQEPEEDFAQEEEIEIDCGVADNSMQIQCKICWSDDQSSENPLLCSCKCDGSVRYIHYDCLKHWLKQKMTLNEQEGCISYTWKQFECEICKTPYPYVFRTQGKKYRLVDVAIPNQGNFLWLESMTFEKNSSRMVHVIRPQPNGKTEFKMGRGHEADLRVSDISVSRCHAFIKYDPSTTQQFYIEDNLSKFGTLVLANNGHVELDLNQTKAIQIGRSVISFTVKKTEPLMRQQSQPPLFQQQQLLKTPSPVKASYEGRKDEEHMRSVEEMLRKKIEETNQKISDYLQQSSAQMQTKPLPMRLGDRQLEPRRVECDDDDLEPQQKIGQHLISGNLRADCGEHGPSAALSETLLKFQSMIKQVEQRFAEREVQVYSQQPAAAMQFEDDANVARYRQLEEEKTADQPPRVAQFDPPQRLSAYSISPQKRHFVNAPGIQKPSGDCNISQEDPADHQHMKNIATDFYYDQPGTQSFMRSTQPQQPSRVQPSKHLSHTVREQPTSQRPVTAQPKRSDSYAARSSDMGYGTHAQSSPHRRYNNESAGKTIHLQNSYAKSNGGYGSSLQRSGTSPVPTRGANAGNKYQTPTRGQVSSASQQRRQTMQYTSKDVQPRSIGSKMRFL